jgi:hypothetical protein
LSAPEKALYRLQEIHVGFEPPAEHHAGNRCRLHQATHALRMCPEIVNELLKDGRPSYGDYSMEQRYHHGKATRLTVLLALRLWIEAPKLLIGSSHKLK